MKLFELVKVARVSGFDKDAIGAFVGKAEEAEDGGPGSGNFGHKGRPGSVGGSGKGGGKHYRSDNPGSTRYRGTRRDWVNGLTGQANAQADRFVKKWAGEIPKNKKGYNATEAAEKNVMEKFGSERSEAMRATASQMLDWKGKAQHWDDKYKDYQDESLSADERKAMEHMVKQFGSQGMPLSARQAQGMEKLDADWQDYYLAMKNKAMGGSDGGVTMPDELAYACGVKERPVEKKPVQTPAWANYSKGKWQNSYVKADMQAFLKSVDPEKFKSIQEDYDAMAYHTEHELSNMLAQKKPSITQLREGKKMMDRICRENDKFRYRMQGRMQVLYNGMDDNPNLSDAEKKQFRELIERNDKDGFAAAGKLKQDPTYGAPYMERIMNNIMRRSTEAHELLQLMGKALGLPPAQSDAETAERMKMLEGSESEQKRKKEQERQQKAAKWKPERDAVQQRIAAAAQARAAGRDPDFSQSEWHKRGSKVFDGMKKQMAACEHKGVQRAVDAYVGDVKIGSTDEDPMKQHYSPADDEIYISADECINGNKIHAPYESAFHESAHAIDARASLLYNGTERGHFSTDYKDGLFAKTIHSEVDQLLADIKSKARAQINAHKGDLAWLRENGYVSATGSDTPSRIDEKAAMLILARRVGRIGTAKAGSLMDVLQGATHTSIMKGVRDEHIEWVGHRDSYYLHVNADKSLATECFAQMVAGHMSSKAQIESFKKFLPKTCKVFDEMMQAITKRED